MVIVNVLNLFASSIFASAVVRVNQIPHTSPRQSP